MPCEGMLVVYIAGTTTPINIAYRKLNSWTNLCKNYYCCYCRFTSLTKAQLRLLNFTSTLYIYNEQERSNYIKYKIKLRGLSPRANYRTERPPLVGEVRANFCWQRVLRVKSDWYLQPYSRFSRPGPLVFLRSSSSIVLTRLSGPRSRCTTSQKIW
jgi:hypothetical protein